MIHVLIRSRRDREHLVLYYVDPVTRREVCRTAGTSNKGEAERAAARWEQELVEFRGSDDAGWEFFVQRFEDEHLATISKGGRKLHKTALRSFRKRVPLKSVGEVTASHLSQYQAALLREKKPLTTISTYLGHLRGAFNWAERMGIIRKAPRVILPKTGKRKLMKGRPLTLAEHQKMLDACPADDWRHFLTLLWLSGLRLNEAMALAWDSPPVQVMLDAKPHPVIMFSIAGQKSREDEACPMPPDFAAWLFRTPPEARRGLVASISGGRAERGTGRNRGGRMVLTSVSKSISAIGKAAGVLVTEKKPASAHDYRRAFGTRWASKVKPMTLRRMMRHATLETTMRYYVTLSSSDIGDELWAGNTPTAKDNFGSDATR